MKFIAQVSALILAPLAANAQVLHSTSNNPSISQVTQQKSTSKLDVETAMNQMSFDNEQRQLVRDLMDGTKMPAQLTKAEIDFIKASPKEFRRMVVESVKAGDPCSC
jgi:hypothetical protein